MKVCIATALVALTASLVLGAGTASAVVHRPKVVHKPTATVDIAAATIVKGKYFKKHERITISLSSSTTEEHWTKKVVATVKGTFTADFGAIGLNSCDQYTLKIVGSLKSRFSMSHSLVPC